MLLPFAADDVNIDVCQELAASLSCCHRQLCSYYDYWLWLSFSPF